MPDGIAKLNTRFQLLFLEALFIRTENSFIFQESMKSDNLSTTLNNG